MSTPKATILLLEDSTTQREVLRGFLTKRGYDVLEAGSGNEAEELSRSTSIDLLLTDLRLGGPDGITVLQSLRKKQPALQCIVLSAYGTVDDATRAMKSGAYDFVAKPVELPRLEALIEKALEKVTLSKEVSALSSLVQHSEAFGDVIGESEKMKAILQVAVKAAASNASILILGESGTGKGVLARAIHLASHRKTHPLHTVSCAALPQTLIEAELFGHEAGAFTGATARKLGRFELAHRGSLFLDEVGEIPLPVQVKLLHVLQTRQFERIGGTETIHSDVRIMAATNQNLPAQIAAGEFREDLYYRLNVVTITLPPLRERPGDIRLLATHFVQKHSMLLGVPVKGIEDVALAYLESCPFPGNIRELENWIERAIVLTENDYLQRSDFPADGHSSSPPPPATATPQPDGGLEAQVSMLEIQLIQDALTATNFNQSAAARKLKISERAIRYKMKKYQL
ncbi:MAG: sigma-54-dependent Fis family transcriptional regulator [Deltaproteobacteria bacterium]|nr:sigma-54-dependent Fis family transcriptional regulator [Deltaproteobacteria bacterium]MBN2672115.1 sigma-54-dependent Fis family transcriptional regulator [Deltaproteobacteria bacterium]